MHRSRGSTVVRPIVQAVRHGSQFLHLLAFLAFGFCVLLIAATSFAAWRLAQGPIDITWLSNRARAALLDEDGPVQISFQRAYLAWGGRQGHFEHLFELLASDIAVNQRNGPTLATAPQAKLTFSVPALLTGRFVPRTLEIDQARLTAHLPARRADNSADVDPSRLIRTLIDRATDRSGMVGRLIQLRLRDGAVALPPSAEWPGMTVSAIDFDARRINGRLRGALTAALAMTGQRSTLAVDFDVVHGGDSRAAIALSAVRPATFSPLLPGLAFASGIDLPVSIRAALTLDPAARLRQAQADINLAGGRLQVAGNAIPVRDGHLRLVATPDGVAISDAALQIVPSDGGAPTRLGLRGSLLRRADRLVAGADLSLDDVRLADLPVLWPAGLGPDARGWVVQHVLDGEVRHGTATLTLEADQGLKHVTVTKAVAALDADHAAFTWLDDMPPVEQAAVHLQLLNPDALDVSVATGHQRIAPGVPDLLIENGVMHITGLSMRDQVAAIHLQTEGPVTSALTLLQRPRLNLLSSHPIRFPIGGGKVLAALDFQFPMKNELTVEEIAVHVGAHLSDVRLPQVVGTNSLEGGSFDLEIGRDGLKGDGQGTLASIPVTLHGSMDFTAGPPGQVMQKIVVTARPSIGMLAGAGADLSSIASGAIPLTVSLVDRRGTAETVTVDGDLGPTRLFVRPLTWSKPAGAPATLNAVFSLKHGQLADGGHFSIDGDNVVVSGAARTHDGQVTSVSLSELRLGRTRAHGTVQLGDGHGLTIVVTADPLDLSVMLSAKRSTTDIDNAPPATTPAWVLNARAVHVLLANDVQASNMLVRGRGEGEAVQLLDAVGTLPGGEAVSCRIDRVDGRRHLRIDSRDAGAVLRGLDVTTQMQGGRLHVDGYFDAPDAYYPLVGSAVMDDVRLVHSPAAVKLLQALTIYGLVEALNGPGMRFAHVDIPFEYDRGAMIVKAARAFNPSLGLTADGHIGTTAGTIALNGTIVPAYFFNSMLGGLPLVGKLFSPEDGGGVFAARFALTGALDNPHVSINPISALAPGFLRNLFATGAPATVPAPR